MYRTLSFKKVDRSFMNVQNLFIFKSKKTNKTRDLIVPTWPVMQNKTRGSVG
jgi:hypothetical protein